MASPSVVAARVSMACMSSAGPRRMASLLTARPRRVVLAIAGAARTKASAKESQSCIKLANGVFSSFQRTPGHQPSSWSQVQTQATTPDCS